MDYALVPFRRHLESSDDVGRTDIRHALASRQRQVATNAIGTCCSIFSLFSLTILFGSVVQGDDFPKVLDKNLKLELIAEAPLVRTPVGIAIDLQERVYVIESHTHFRPNNYDGPPADRILCFEKKGEKYEPTVFFEGTTHTMGLGFHPDGSLYVATRMEIFKLNDKNDNGKIEESERTNVIKHETPGNYPHNGLSGFAFDPGGNVFFGQGENLGADYKLIGSDGITISGGGEGGNIYSCRADGSKLRRVATGFWNPFHMHMDPLGRLFAVDNDPDSRPPCRLLHIVEGGDYGYRFRNGRKGLHPFTSWNGEIYGTLPMISGTGEAPSGIAVFTALVTSTENSTGLAVTSWGDHRIETYATKSHGASFVSDMKPLVVGGENFRPVGIAQGQYCWWFSDWVDKSYQLHGKGRLWKLTYIGARNPTLPPVTNDRSKKLPRETASEDPLGPNLRAQQLEFQHENPLGGYINSVMLLGGAIGTPPPLPDSFNIEQYTDRNFPGCVRYAAARRLNPAKHRNRLLEILNEPDPFMQHAARQALKSAAEELTQFDFEKESRVLVRLGIAVIIRQLNSTTAQSRIPDLLRDSDPRVRFLAIQWIGEERLHDIWQQERQELEKRLATRQDLEAFLATQAFLDNSYNPKNENHGEAYVAGMFLNPHNTPERFAFLLRMVRYDNPVLTEERLQKWFATNHARLQLAVLQVIAQRGQAPQFLNLAELAQDDKRPLEQRLEAIGLLSPANPNYVPLLQNLAKHENALIASQAARSLRNGEGNEKLAADPTLAKLIPPPKEKRPKIDDPKQWEAICAVPGNPKAGEYVFHHAVAQCSRCHEVENRGNAIGPNLTGIGKTMTRERLLESILQTSKEIAPRFAMWQIELKDGKLLKGMYVDEEVDGTVLYADEQGRKFKVHPRDIEQRTQQQLSVMPEGLPYRLTDQELRDLLAYLSK